MTVYSKTTPIGIDRAIKKCQDRLESELTWTADIYGRLYRNTDKKGNIIAEAFISGKEYRDIFVNDRVDAVVGFLVNQDRDFVVNQTTVVKIVCSVKLDRIYNATTERNDEEALQEFVMVVQNVGGWDIQSASTDSIETVFDFMSTDKIKFRDMQPYANFSLEVNVNYKNNICEIL